MTKSLCRSTRPQLLMTMGHSSASCWLQVLSEEESARAQSALDGLAVFLDTALLVSSAQQARFDACAGGKEQGMDESAVSLTHIAFIHI